MSPFDWKETIAVSATLFFILDPLGNIPVFHSILGNYSTPEKTRIIIRELVISLFILMIFLLAGSKILSFLGLSQPSLNIAGGTLLFVIALKMVFPMGSQEDTVITDPFIVPLAMPLLAGPSALAVLLLLSSSQPDKLLEWIVSLLMAWSAAFVLLVASPFILHRLGDSALHAVTRLMGMLLILVAVQMFLNGITQYVLDLRMKG
jgi:multiple antibiotic resistance protein